MKKSLILLLAVVLVVALPLAKASPTGLWVWVSANDGFTTEINAYADPHEADDGNEDYYTKTLHSVVDTSKGSMFAYLTMDQPDSPAITFSEGVDSEGCFSEYLVVHTIDPETDSQEYTACFIVGSSGEVFKYIGTTSPGKYSTLRIDINYITDPLVLAGHYDESDYGRTVIGVGFWADEYVRDSSISLGGFEDEGEGRYAEFNVIGSYNVYGNVNVNTDGSAEIDIEVIDLIDETELIGEIEVITNN